MAVVVLQDWDPGRIGDTDAELHYVCYGTTDPDTAQTAVAGTAPSTYGGNTLDYIEVSEYLSDQLGGCFRATAYYKKASSQQSIPETDDAINSFQIGGGSFHLNYSIKNINYYKPGGGEKSGDHESNAINVVSRDGKNEVLGVDLPELSGAQLVNLTRYISAAKFTSSYRKTVSLLVHRVNNAAFTIVGIDQYDAGEVLFLGLDATQRGDGSDWEAQFRFAVRPNIADACADWEDAYRPAQGGNPLAVPKKGWEYFWVQSKEKKVGNSLISVPKLIVVDQVFYTDNLSQLNP